jgi:hypothetical protein
MTNLLILNSQLIVPSMQYEFGGLTPSELPLGNKCLLEAQIASLKQYDNYYITLLPNTIQSSEVFNRTLQRYEFNLIKIKSDIDLSAVVFQALNFITDKDSQIDVLFSDTIIKNISQVDRVNMMSGHTKPNHDHWYGCIDDDKLAFSGFSSFKNVSTLRNYMRANNNNYLKIFDELKLDVSSASEWYDFGRVSTYYKSRLQNSEARHFNSLKINNQFIKKSSDNEQKIKREWEWFCNAPEALSWYTPKVSKAFDSSYQIKSISAPTLADLFVFGKHEYDTFEMVSTRCCDVLSTTVCAKFSDEEISVAKLRKYTKDADRIGALSDTFPAFSNYEENLATIYHDLLQLEKEYDKHYTSSYMHGDFCFSNILFDFRSETPYLIDPRGGFSNESFCGFLEYDVAKFFHSLIGYYDSIVSEHYDLLESDGVLRIYANLNEINRNSLKEKFISSLGLSGEQTMLVYVNLILLFITMIPLHKDNEKRQIALALNAIDLYRKYFEK